MGSTARRQLALAVVLTVVIVAAGGALPWLVPQAGVEQVESVLGHLQPAIMFGAASLGLLSGRWVARTSLGFTCAALLVLAFAGAVSGTVRGKPGSFRSSLPLAPPSLWQCCWGPRRHPR